MIFFMRKLLLIPLVLAGCSHSPELSDDVVAIIGTETLTKQEVARVVPAGLSAPDSTAFADAWVNAWVNDRLLETEATRYLRNLDDIERRVADYRRNLIAWEYRRLAVATDPSLVPSDSAMQAYYDANGSSMRLDEPMLRGIYIKMETSDPALKTVRSLYRSSRLSDIDRLEKVGLNGAVHYDYFRDQWIPWQRIVSKIPYEIDPAQLRKGYNLDVDVNGFTYLLSVSDLLPAGSQMPFEAARPRILSILETENAAALDARLLQRLRGEALESGRLKLQPAS